MNETKTRYLLVVNVLIIISCRRLLDFHYHMISAFLVNDLIKLVYFSEGGMMTSIIHGLRVRSSWLISVLLLLRERTIDGFQRGVF